jgi:hypothetical protein
MPAGAHFRQNTLHLAKHVWNDYVKQRVYTRGQANNRYLRATQMKIAAHGPWVLNNSFSNGEVQNFSDQVRMEASGTSNILGQLYLQRPVLLGNRTFALKSVEICYMVSSGDKIDTITIRDDRTSSTAIQTDTTDLTATTMTCYTSTLSTPTVPTGSLVMLLTFDPDAALDFMGISSVTSTWIPKPV